MNHLWNLVRKELKELLTVSSVISVIAVTAIMFIMGQFISAEVDDSISMQPIGYINLSGPGTIDYADIGIQAMKDYYAANGIENVDEYVILIGTASEYGTDEFEKEIYDAMAENNLETVLIFAADFNSNLNGLTGRGEIIPFWNQSNLSAFNTISIASSAQMISLIGNVISIKIVNESTSLNENESAIASTPVRSNGGSTFLNGTLYEGVTPTDIFSAVSKQSLFVPVIIMIIIMMVGSIVISSMGNEKENKTLETLLTLPVNRTTIVAGKLVGSALAGLVMGTIYMIGMFFYVDGIAGRTTTSVSMDSLGLSLSLVDWGVVTIFIFMTIMCALGICMILGAFAKNYKAAQTYILPIVVLTTIPMFITMFSSIDGLPMGTKVVMFIIPFTHAMAIIQNLMFGNMVWVVGGMAYLTAFTAVVFLITVKLYKSDILITGLARKDRKEESIKLSFAKKRSDDN